MAWTKVQSQSRQGSTAAYAYASAPTMFNLLIAAISEGDDPAGVTIVDNLGQSWRNLDQYYDASNDQGGRVWWTVAESNAALTVTFSGMSGSFYSQMLAEFSPAVTGTIVQDQTNGAFINSGSTATDAFASGNITGSADEMLYLAFLHNFNSSVSFTTGTGWTLGQDSTGFTTLEWQSANSGTKNGSFTKTAGGTGTAYVHVVSFGQQSTASFPVADDASDGTGNRQAATWGGIGSGTYTDESNSVAVLYAQKTFFGGNYTVSNGYARWDTSSLASVPPTSIVGASVWITADSVGNADTLFSLNGDYYDFGGEPSVAADWIRDTGSPLFSKSLLTITTLTPYQLPLNSLSGINTSGYTGIRFTLDDSTTPTGSNYVGIIAHEYGAGWPGPQLDVTYWTYPAGGSLTLVDVLPDADTTTTGWSTAPLFSKINDASDATVITGTST